MSSLRGFVVGGLFSALLLALPLAAPAAESPEAARRQEIETVVREYLRYQCGYCKGQAIELRKLLQSDPDIRLVYKELPILGPVSTFAARAALAARGQGKYETLHAALMAASERLTEQGVLQIAAQVGLDAARLEKDMADPAVAETLARSARLGEALGIRGTPALIVGTELAPGAADLDALKRLVGQARKK